MATASSRPPLCSVVQATHPETEPAGCLVERLLAAGVAQPEQINTARREAMEKSQRLLDVLVDGGVVEERTVAALLSYELGLPWVDPALIRFDLRLCEALPRWVAEALCVLPVHFQERDDGSVMLFVAMDDPTDHETLLACSVWAGVQVRPLVASTRAIRQAIKRWYDDPRMGRIPFESHVLFRDSEVEAVA